MIFKTEEVKIEQITSPGEKFTITKIGNELMIDVKNKNFVSIMDIRTFAEVFKFVEENIKK